MVEETDLENVARLKVRLEVENGQLLDAIQSKELPLLLDASGYFIAPAERQMNGKYKPLGPFRHYEAGFLYVAANYFQKLDWMEVVEMGLACSEVGGGADRIIRLKGGRDKPALGLNDLYVAKGTAEALFVKDTLRERRFAEGIDAAKALLRQKFREGKLRNDEDYARWMKLEHVINQLRGDPDIYLECAKTKPKQKTGNTKDREPALTKALVGLLKNSEIQAEYRRLVSRHTD